MKKRITAFITAFCLMMTCVTAFADSTAEGDGVQLFGHWAQTEINALYRREIIPKNGSFLPDGNVTRGQWFVWLGKNMILPFIKGENTFSDITEADECYNYAEAFFANGVIPAEMIQGGAFEKNRAITRQEMIYTAVASMKLRLSREISTGEPAFTDKNKISAWAIDSVKTAVGEGVVKNGPAYSFRPDEYATGGECAFVLDRIYNVFRTDFEYTRHIRILKTANGAQGTSSRSYVYSALCLLYMGTDIDKANNLLNEKQIVNAKTFDDFEASPFILYWSIPSLIRIYIQYNSRTGTLRRDVLRPETEENLLKIMWSVVESYYLNVYSEDNDPLRGIDSENHDSLKKSSLYLIAQILSKEEGYKDKILPDGKTLTEFIAHAEDFYEKFVLNRAQTGFFVEGSENYRVVTYEGLYNVMEFTDNKELSDKIKMLVDVSWIEYSVESLNGIRGNAKTRVYNKKGDADTGYMWFSMLGSMYFGLNPDENPSPIITLLMSEYRPPEIAKEIATTESKGYYKLIKGMQGFGTLNMISFGTHTGPEYTFDGDRDVITYEYITPDYIASTMYQDDISELTILSSQNRWEGAIFKGDVNARIYRYLDTERSLYGHFQSMQNGPIMMFRKNNSENLATGIYIYPFEFMEKDGELPCENGWLFGQIGDSYYAVKPLTGTLEQRNGKIYLTDSESPFIIHIGSKKENCCFDRFKEMIKNNLLSYNGNTVYYKDPVWGEMEFNPMRDPQKARIINRSSVPYKLDYITQSPYLNSVRNSGIYKVDFGGKHIEYDFNTCTMTEEIR